ncbi:MAG: hypothetical protein ACHRHE_15680, partial [Tepidisphaerales bacterium]
MAMNITRLLKLHVASMLVAVTACLAGEPNLARLEQVKALQLRLYLNQQRFERLKRKTSAAARKLEEGPAALRQRLLEHIAEVVQATSKYGFDEYDVTNELRQLHDLTDILGQDV